MRPLWCRSLLVAGLCSLMIGCVAHTPAPVSGLKKDYTSIERGSYRGSYYEVRRGDTLYYIAYITDKNVNDIIRYNNLPKPYTIHPGQKLKLWQPAYTPPAYGGTGAGPAVAVAKAASAPVKVAVSAPKPIKTSNSSNTASTSQTANVTADQVKKYPGKGVEQSKPKEYVGSVNKQTVNKKVSESSSSNAKLAQSNAKPASSNAKPASSSTKVAKWMWPTKGRVIQNFSAGDQGNKGIDIAGQRGQSIMSTAAGTVVYSGSALRGYGNLVIIKHNDHYLSAYAHNDRLLVKEGQNVNAGQKIATMGSSGASSVRLHFEIRYQGKSVNPKRYLP